MTLNLEPHLRSFFQLIQTGEVEIYNEASIQHELAIYLRRVLPAGFKVQLERNTAHFGIARLLKLHKSEIDIVVYNEQERHAIEIKNPRNGQHPVSMFSFCEDLRFLEQLTEQGFTSGYGLIVTEDPGFYTAKRDEKQIYQYFRQGHPVTGTVISEIVEASKVRRPLEFTGSHTIRWETLEGNLRFALVTLGTTLQANPTSELP